MTIELYINKQLVEFRDPSSISINLIRQFLHPSELNAKDAQATYSITLPASYHNNEIFGFLNIEEARNKFTHFHDALLVIAGVEIFKGQFQMTEITNTEYKGLLVVLVQKSISDIFGDKMMNQGGDWIIPFERFKNSIKEYNNKDHSPCIFPFALYGLLPKDVLKNSGKFSSKTLWDEQVVIHRDDLPPSINCLQAVRRIFDNAGYRLSGSAFNDPRLSEIYVSYKNPSDYQMPWNFGIGRIRLEGYWTNLDRTRGDKVEKNYYSNNENNPNIYIANLFYADNAETNILEDNFNSVQVNNDENGNKNHVIIIPTSGLYKVTLNGSLRLGKQINFNKYVTGTRVISAGYTPSGNVIGNSIYENFSKRRFEFKVLRDWGDSEFEIEKQKYDRSFYKDNLDQDKNPNQYPKFFPNPEEVVFIDPLQNNKLLCGLSFGENYGNNNPLDENNFYCNPIAIRNGRSWVDDRYTGNTAKSAIYSSGYMTYDKDVEGELNYFSSDQFKVDLRNTRTYARTGDDYMQGQGQVEQIVWLDEGERLAVVALSDEGKHERSNSIFSTTGWIEQTISYSLTVESFMETDEWLTMNDEGASTDPMYWNDDSDFLSESINLMRFLPSDVKINDWLDNFCKAFNLSLTHTGLNTFELNIKQKRDVNFGNIVDLSSKAHVNAGRSNASLKLPSIYDIGFTIDREEEGYFRPKPEEKDDGGGRYTTDSPTLTTIKQTSNFSFNWFKGIELKEDGKKYLFPVISDKEVWNNPEFDYLEMQKKDYINKAQRFWYRNGTLEVPGFENGKIEVALVSNSYSKSGQRLNLDYHNEPFSIMKTYFLLFLNSDNCYTNIDCYLTSEEYLKLEHSYVCFNSDLYYVAEINPYDPIAGRASLKIIRKMG